MLESGNLKTSLCTFIEQGFPKRCTKSFNVAIFRSMDENNTFNYGTIIMSPILAK